MIPFTATWVTIKSDDSGLNIPQAEENAFCVSWFAVLPPQRRMLAKFGKINLIHLWKWLMIIIFLPIILLPTFKARNFKREYFSPDIQWHLEAYLLSPWKAQLAFPSPIPPLFQYVNLKMIKVVLKSRQNTRASLFPAGNVRWTIK